MLMSLHNKLVSVLNVLYNLYICKRHKYRTQKSNITNVITVTQFSTRSKYYFVSIYYKTKLNTTKESITV